MARILAYTTPADRARLPARPRPARAARARARRAPDRLGRARRRAARRRPGRAGGRPAHRSGRGVTDYEVRGRDRLHRGLQDLLGRGDEQRADLERHDRRLRPDVLLIDTIAYGAAVGAEKSGLPWASVMPSLIPFPGKGIPPYGLGLKPMRGPLGWVRDKVLFRVVLREYAKAMMPRLNALRADAGLRRWRTRSRTSTARPDAGADGRAARVPARATRRRTCASWARRCGTRRSRRPRGCASQATRGCWSRARPSIRATRRLAAAAIEGLRDEPVRVIVTLADAHGVGELPTADNVRVERFVPAWAGARARRGGRSATAGWGSCRRRSRAGVPIVAVPFGRDQPEVSRRIAESGTGVLVKRRT